MGTAGNKRVRVRVRRDHHSVGEVNREPVGESQLIPKGEN